MSSPTPNRLSNIRLKIERAKHHIIDLEGRWRAFLKSDPDILLTENDPETGHLLYKLRRTPVIPIELPLIIGDTLHNLRAALDHLIYEFHPKGRPRNTGYPISNSASEYPATKKRVIKGIDSRIRKLIDATQPYKGGNNSLWKLHELDNIDKHRLILTAASIPVPTVGPKDRLVKRVFPDLELPIHISTLPSDQDGFRIAEAGATLLSIPPICNSQQDTNVEPGFDIAINEPGIAEGQPAIPFLNYLSNLVDGIVNQFIPFL